MAPHAQVPVPGPQLCQPRPIPLTGPGAAPSPARPAASRTPSIVKDTPCDGCPHCWSPLASQETFCYLQDEAKSLVRLKIPSDRTPFGGCPRQTEHNLDQSPAAQAAPSCQPARRPPAAQHQAAGRGEGHVPGRGSWQPWEMGNQRRNSLFPRGCWRRCPRAAAGSPRRGRAPARGVAALVLPCSITRQGEPQLEKGRYRARQDCLGVKPQTVLQGVPRSPGPSPPLPSVVPWAGWAGGTHGSSSPLFQRNKEKIKYSAWLSDLSGHNQASAGCVLASALPRSSVFHQNARAIPCRLRGDSRPPASPLPTTNHPGFWPRRTLGQICRSPLLLSATVLNPPVEAAVFIPPVPIATSPADSRSRQFILLL